MNALGLSAMFGILVLVFQDGNLQGLLAYQSLGALDATQPILLFAVGFGLATDYGVFLLSRIKEARDAGRAEHRGGRDRSRAHRPYRHRRGAPVRGRDRRLLDLADRVHQGARPRRGARGADRRLDHPRAARAVADGAARPAQLVGAAAAAAAARPHRAARGRPAGRRDAASCFTSRHDGPGHGNGRIRAVVFDLGGVLLDWNPRYLYRKLFDGDEAAMERFLAEVCTMEWHHAHDLGVPPEETCPPLADAHPDQAELIWAWSRRSEEMVAGPIEESVELLADLKAAGVPVLRADEHGARDLSAAPRAVRVPALVRRHGRVRLRRRRQARRRGVRAAARPLRPGPVNDRARSTTRP